MKDIVIARTPNLQARNDAFLDSAAEARGRGAGSGEERWRRRIVHADAAPDEFAPPCGDGAAHTAAAATHATSFIAKAAPIVVAMPSV